MLVSVARVRNARLPRPLAAMASQVTQYGITWTFDREYPTGQFVNGDWWVIGPVNVVTVTPGPSPAPPDEVTSPGVGLQDNIARRNGSMVVMTPDKAQGYDSRGTQYSSSTSINFPYTLGVDRSLISSISQTSTPNPVLYEAIMWQAEKSDTRIMKTAAVLTCLAAVPPADAFRPSYVGGDKQIFRAANLRWDRLLNLPSPGGVTFTQYARYFQRPWIDHFSGRWELQTFAPVDNQPGYGREIARIGGVASLLLNTNGTDDEKRALLYGFVQYGIDLRGSTQLGARWDGNGGHNSGRKWPQLFAGLMLDDPSFTPPTPANFGEDQQSYFGLSYYGSTALYTMAAYTVPTQPYQERLPSTWDSTDRKAEAYRTCCTVPAWVGEGLAALLMGQKAAWNHDAMFGNLEDWMRQTDLYAADRQGNLRPSQEGWTDDPFVDAFWAQHRGAVPAQPDGSTNLRWDVNKAGGPGWVPN